MKTILTKKFFHQNTLRVARALLGTFLVRKIGKKEIAGMITEVEAYDGFNDTASHASRGKTKRNQVMFQEGGKWYVYFTYGIHWMLNVVTREKEYPAAILIRGIIIDEIVQTKTNGPGKLTKFLHIDKHLNGKAANKKTGLWIEDRGYHPKKILQGPRIGVGYAGTWKDTPWRFFIQY